jgi:aryl-alcohol dehydrogenase-like predicted oxidoreductase
MRYRLLGKFGVRISEVALGTMTFGEDWGWGHVGNSRNRRPLSRHHAR